MNHGEAFALMKYDCKNCSFVESIWNSRDGVTPFCITCRRCGMIARHTRWDQDEFMPNYDPRPGDRYFRDGLEAEARAVMRKRLERGKNTPYEIPEDKWDAFIDTIDYNTGEFQPGWPMLVIRGSDADFL